MTLRELVPMCEARNRADWARTSAVLAMLANTNRDPKKHRPFTPTDFDPTAKRTAAPALPPEPDLSILKKVFVNREAPRRPSNERSRRPLQP